MNKKTITGIIIVLLSLITIGVIFLSVFKRFSFVNNTFSAPASASMSESMDCDAFDTINIETDVASISIRNGSSYKVEYSYRNSLNTSYEPKVSLEAGALSITQKLPPNSMGNGECSIIIYVPSGNELKDIKIRNDVGNIEIEDVNAKKTDVQTDVGEIKIENMKADKLTACSDVGNVTIKNVISGKTTLTGDVGDITANSCELGDLELSNSIGDITLDDTTYTDLDTSADIGTINVNGEKRNAMFDD